MSQCRDCPNLSWDHVPEEQRPAKIRDVCCVDKWHREQALERERATFAKPEPQRSRHERRRDEAMARKHKATRP